VSLSDKLPDRRRNQYGTCRSSGASPQPELFEHKVTLAFAQSGKVSIQIKSHRLDGTTVESPSAGIGTFEQNFTAARELLQ
jgi:hypothetical protein